jgi:ABC-type polysaccharide/polyol phosphate export systems, permease component
MYGGEGVTSYDYYGVTIMIFLVINGCTIAPNTFMERRIKNGNIRIAFSPTRKWEIYMSKIVSSFTFIGVLFTIVMIFLSITHIVNFGGENFKYVLALILVLLFFTTALGTFVCVLLKDEETTNKILSFICNILALTSGIFFPVDGLGSWIKRISDFSPVKQVIQSIFTLIYDGSFKNYNVTISMIMLLTVALIIGIHFSYKPENFI